VAKWQILSLNPSPAKKEREREREDSMRQGVDSRRIVDGLRLTLGKKHETLA
jgi:hypothetical protein